MAIIRQDELLGVSAFTNKGDLAMNFGAPTVGCYLRITDLENWLTTLEETMEHVPAEHKNSLSWLIITLRSIHDKHIKEHQEIVTEAPTADDQIAYLAAYAAAIGGGLS